jgi:MOSC domain-containing protein YiiM
LKVLSVNLGRVREAVWRGESVPTGFFKAPVQGRVRVERERLEGDEQADLTVHGGPDKAVYVYPGEHYAYWRAELPGVDLPPGSFGENLTTEGLLEREVRVGDRLRIGTAEFAVTQPRLPCYKLSIRFRRADMVKRFWRSGRTGFYLSVEKLGEVGAGDVIEAETVDASAITIAELVATFKRDHE